MANSSQTLLSDLKKIVGKRHVLTRPRAMERFCRGYRSGAGEALAVVRPGTLLEQWHILRACTENGVVVIMQAANTGLTEGSTPSGQYDRDVVIVSTLRLDRIHLLDQGNQVVSLPGATLYALEKLLDPLGRVPHSVIGSSCLGASITGGVCNNSGGSLIERGPSYTEMAVFARVNEDGVLQLVNHLGIELGNSPEEILANLDTGAWPASAVQHTDAQASDKDYQSRVREVDAPTPARYNADPRRLHEASGCAGKLAVFATRLDTYPQNPAEKTFYIGTNSIEVLTKLRRDLLQSLSVLPVSAEYMQRPVYDIAKRYGKDTLVMIDKLGTQHLPAFFALKGNLDARLNKLPLLPNDLVDRVLQRIANFWPNVLPPRMEAFREQYEHHLLLTMHDAGIAEAETYLRDNLQSTNAGWFACNDREASLAGLHRFAAAGAAVRYRAVHAGEVADIVALDVALPRNARDWFEVLPPELDAAIEHKLYYGHFFCHVLHQDYIVKNGFDPAHVKEQLLALLAQRGAKYPAEHNVGHLYPAEEPLATFYRECDPTNAFNPGIGQTSRQPHYRD